MKTIKGIFENGQIKLLETPPQQTVQKVLVTFIEDDEESEIRNTTLQTNSDAWKQYLEDKREDLYDEYIKQ